MLCRNNPLHGVIGERFWIDRPTKHANTRAIMKSSHSFPALGLSLVLCLLCCASIPATQDSLKKAFAEKNASYLAAVSSGKIKASDTKTKDYASQLIRELRRAEISKTIQEAKSTKDTKKLELLLAQADKPYFEADLRRVAQEGLTELKRGEILREIEAAKSADDLVHLKALASDTSRPYLGPDLRSRAEGYVKELQALLAKRESERLIKASDTRLEAAFADGNLAFLRQASTGTVPSGSDFLDSPSLRKKAAVLLGVAENPGRSIARLRASALDPRSRDIHPMIKSFLSSAPSQYIDPLVSSLVKNVYDPFERIKLLHDWIADNIRYNFEGYLKGNLGDNSWEGVIRTGQSVCAGYANLFDHMCKLAGIDCRVVSGLAKGYGYDPLGQSSKDSNHAWNIVTVGGTEYLVDVTWDSGYINGFSQNVKAYSTEYLFPAPGSFIYDHYPETPKDQLLEKPISLAEFAALPGIGSSFFEKGLDFLGPRLPGILEVAGRGEIILKCPDSIVLTSAIRGMDNQAFQDSSMVLQENGTAKIFIALPEKKPYMFVLFGGTKGGPRLELIHLMSLVVVNTGESSVQPAYPEFFQDYYLGEFQLLGPLQGILKKGEKYTISVRAPKAERLDCVIDKAQTPFIKGPDGVFTLTQQVAGGTSLEVFADDGSGGGKGLLRYTIK